MYLVRASPYTSLYQRVTEVITRLLSSLLTNVSVFYSRSGQPQMEQLPILSQIVIRAATATNMLNIKT